MKISKISENKLINCPNKTYSSLNRISFKGADEFVKSTVIPTEDEFLQITRNNKEAKAYNLYEILSKINSKIFNEKISPLIEGEYKEQYEEYFKLVSKNGKLRRLGEFADNLMSYLSKQFFDLPGFEIKSQNALTVMSKDNQTAQDVLDFLPFYMKIRATDSAVLKDPNIKKEWYNPFDYCFKNHFKRISGEDTKNLPHEEIHKLIYSALEQAEENYKKTSAYTALKVDVIEELIKQDNPNPEIAWMKLITQCSLNKYHTVFLMPVSDRENLATGINTRGRIGNPFVLEELGITKEDVEKLKEIQNKTQPLADKVEECFKDENSKDVQFLRIIRKKLNTVIEEDCNYRKAFYKLSEEISQENQEKIMELVSKINKETEEAKNESFPDTFRKIYEDFIQPEKSDKILQETSTKQKETAKQTGEIVQNTVNTIKSGIFARIKGFFKNNKKILGIVSLITLTGIAIFAILRKKTNINLEQKNNNRNISLLKNISFSEFKNSKA